MNKSYHTYEYCIPHTSMSHESWHKYECFVSHTSTSNESWRKFECFISHISVSHESWHKYECFVSHTLVNHVIQMGLGYQQDWFKREREILLLPYTRPTMRHVTLVGSLKFYVSFAEYSLFYGAFLQQRPIILRNLLSVATPCGWVVTNKWRAWRSLLQNIVSFIWLFCKRDL